MSEQENEQSPRPVIPADDPAALGYEAPRDRLVRDPPLNVLAVTVIVVVCGAMASALLALLSGVLFMGMNPLSGTQPVGYEEFVPKSRAADLVVGALFGLAFIAVCWIYYIENRGMKEPRNAKQWMIAGALIGIGITCLIEGACFSLT